MYCDETCIFATNFRLNIFLRFQSVFTLMPVNITLIKYAKNKSRLLSACTPISKCNCEREGEKPLKLKEVDLIMQ